VRANYGVRLDGSSHIVFSDNAVDWSFDTGIIDSRTTSSVISRNTIRYSGSAAIVQDELSSYGLIEGNLVYAAGAQLLGEDPVNGDAMGMAVFGIRTRVIGNRIDCTGYDGLYVGRGSTSGREVAYNYISNTCLCLADGAGIYTDGRSNSSEPDYIHHNIVADTMGWLGGWSGHERSSPIGEGYGIYIDEQANNRIIEYNTILNCSGPGIFVHWAQDNRLTSNILYGNGMCQLLLVGKDDPRFRLKGNIMSDNLLIATSPDKYTLRIQIDYSEIDLGGSDQNRYYHPTDQGHILLCAGQSIACNPMTLDQWQAISKMDLISADLSPHSDSMAASPVIFTNPSMCTSIIPLADSQYVDPCGRLVKDVIVLGAFESVVLLPVPLTQ
jgi:parallel beta-helix repeat protein